MEGGGGGGLFTSILVSVPTLLTCIVGLIAKLRLLDLINEMWITSKIPSSWQHAVVAPLFLQMAYRSDYLTVEQLVAFTQPIIDGFQWKPPELTIGLFIDMTTVLDKV